MRVVGTLIYPNIRTLESLTQPPALRIVHLCRRPTHINRYRRLQMLQSRLTNGIQHRAGLNPKYFRTISSTDRHGARRNVLDGNLLSVYLSLGLVEQTEFAKRIGTTASQIIADLNALATARAAL